MLISTALRNSILTKLALEFEGSNTAEIELYAGVVAATADADISGNTLLGTISTNGDGTALTLGSPVNGIIGKTGTEVWSVTPIADGTATFYRFIIDTDAGGLSTTAIRIQGTVGAANADMLVDSTTFVIGVARIVSAFSIGMPAT